MGFWVTEKRDCVSRFIEKLEKERERVRIGVLVFIFLIGGVVN